MGSLGCSVWDVWQRYRVKRWVHSIIDFSNWICKDAGDTPARDPPAHIIHSQKGRRFECSGQGAAVDYIISIDSSKKLPPGGDSFVARSFPTCTDL